MKNTVVSIVLPAYNERENLLRLIPAIFECFSHLEGWTPEILVVDDNSPDGTTKALTKRFARRIRIVVRKHERGLATAIAAGVRASSGRIILGMDADGNHDPNAIPALLLGLSDNDLVIGSRFVSGGRIDWNVQGVLSVLSNSILYHIFRFPVHDCTSGYYVIRKSTLFSLGLTQIYRGYGDYHIRLVWRAAVAGLHIREIPVQYARRHHGQSKSRLPIMLVTYAKTVADLLRDTA